MLDQYIQGYGLLQLEVLALDYNGTVAIDGKLKPSIKKYLNILGEYLDIFIITSDTHGTVQEQCKELPVKVKILLSSDHTQEKAEFVNSFGQKQVVSIGNGSNDRKMIQNSKIGIAVIGQEGCSGMTLSVADIVVNSIEDAFDLLIKRQRLVATLRQ